LAEDTSKCTDLNGNVRQADFILLRGFAKTPHLAAVKSATNFAVVLVTAPSLKIGRALAKAALEAKLVACANLISRLESHYWWHGKLERSAEVLILFKTAKHRLHSLESLVLAKHPYDTPEFLALPLDSGTSRYLDWLSASMR